MQCSCARDALSRALIICADLCRVFPETFHATLHARAGEGSLDVLLWNEASGVGVLAQVPAEIVEAGSATVPTRMTACTLAAMPQGRLSLSSIIIPDSDLVPGSGMLKPIKGGPALQIEGTSETGASQRTRLRLCTPTAEHASPPALVDWQMRGIPLASIAPSALRETWEPCVLLAKERVEAAEETPDMNHALVLCRLDQQELVCTATTRSAVVQTRQAWMRLADSVPVSHTLLDECMLRWIMTVLKGETEPVILTLLPQEAPTALVLFSLPHVTLVCRGKTAPIPHVWERRISAPSSQTLLLSRTLLMKALDFLSADRAGHADRCLLLSVADHRLCLQWDPLVPEDHTALCQLPIVNTIAESEPVLVHLRSLRQMVRHLKGPAICLERGAIMLRKMNGETKEPAPIGFVRLSKPADATAQMMMTISEHVSPPPKTDPTPEAVSETPEAGEKGVALATVSSDPGSL